MKKEELEAKKLSKYLKVTARALIVLADEINKDKKLTKESEELMSKIGSHVLFHAKTYYYKV